jgi:hypothetical protein
MNGLVSVANKKKKYRFIYYIPFFKFSINVVTGKGSSSLLDDDILKSNQVFFFFSSIAFDSIRKNAK